VLFEGDGIKHASNGGMAEERGLLDLEEGRTGVFLETLAVVGAGAVLYHNNASFRARVDKGAAYIRRKTGMSLLPKNWVEEKDEHKNKIWHNTVTGQYSHVLPRPEPDDPDGLPEHWEPLVNAKGIAYYYNTKTKESTFEKPKRVAPVQKNWRGQIKPPVPPPPAVGKYGYNGNPAPGKAAVAGTHEQFGTDEEKKLHVNLKEATKSLDKRKIDVRAFVDSAKKNAGSDTKSLESDVSSFERAVDEVTAAMTRLTTAIESSRKKVNFKDVDAHLDAFSLSLSASNKLFKVVIPHLKKDPNRRIQMLALGSFSGCTAGLTAYRVYMKKMKKAAHESS
jgi:hypothetical protein